MDQADPNLPAGIALPELGVQLPPSIDPDRYRRLGEAFGALKALDASPAELLDGCTDPFSVRGRRHS